MFYLDGVGGVDYCIIY